MWQLRSKAFDVLEVKGDMEMFISLLFLVRMRMRQISGCVLKEERGGCIRNRVRIHPECSLYMWPRGVLACVLCVCCLVRSFVLGVGRKQREIVL